MGLRFEHAFTVKSPADRVWAYLTDPYRVAPALPGAAVTDKKDDGSYGGTITVKVGPVSAKYKGTLRFDALDAAARTAVMSAKGQDLSGRGGADMKMESKLVEKAPSETEVTVVSDVNVTGLLAQLGRGLMQDVSNQMFQRFTEAMKKELESPEPSPEAPAPSASPSADTTTTATTSASTSTSTSTSTTTSMSSEPVGSSTTASTTASPPIEVVSFGTKILARAAGRTMRRPLFWVVAAVVAGSIYWLVGR